MILKIKRIKFSRLWKLEVAELANSVIEIVEKYNPETLKIDEIFDLLVEQRPQIELLEVEYGPHPITQELQNLRRRRIAFAQGIINQVRTIEYGKMEGTVEPMKVVKPVVNRYLLNLSRNNNRITSQKVTQFFEHIEEKPEVNTAMEALDLTLYLNQLQSVHSVLREQFNNRRDSISKRPKGITPSVVKSILTAMKNLFLQIELAQVKNPELDYTPLVDELNDELTNFGWLINMRASYNKKKAEGNIVYSRAVVDDDSEEPIKTTESNTRMHSQPIDEVEISENSGELDKKKTVAMSSKPMRLPISSNEA